MSSPIKVTQKKSTITPRQKFEGHTKWVSGTIHLPGGRRMMTSSVDGSLWVWDLKSGKQIGDDWQDGESAVWCMALSPDGKKVVSGCGDGGVRLWDIDTGEVVKKWMGHTKMLNSVCWSRDGLRVLSGSLDGTARQWDVENGETSLAPIKTGHKYVWAVVYSPDTTMFATGGWDESTTETSVKIWDAKTGELVATLKGHTDLVLCLAWTPDGKTLISGSADNSIRTWSTTTWKQLALLDGHTRSVYVIAISPNGRILASASWDNTARLWSLDNNQPISLPLHHADRVFSVSFSADGKLLATGCHNKKAYTWDVSAILKEAGQLDKWLLAGNVTRRPVRPFDLSADATQRPVRQPIKVPQRRVPQGFFDDPPPDRAHLSARLNPRSWASHVSTVRGHFSSLFLPTHPNAHDTPSRPRPFHWVRNRLSGRPSGEDIELHERRSEVIDVPYAKGKRRNASAREKRRPITRPILNNATAGSSRPPNSTVTQQSSGANQAQSSSQPQAAVSTSIAPPVVANTTSGTNPHITIQHAGRWTRFWLFVCCASTEHTDGHH